MTHLIEALSSRRLILWAGVLLTSLWLQSGQGRLAAGVLLLLWWIAALWIVTRDTMLAAVEEAERDIRVGLWIERSKRLQAEKRAAAAAGKDGA